MVGEINIDNIMTKDTNKILFNARMCTQSIYNVHFSALDCIFFAQNHSNNCRGAWREALSDFR